MSSGDTQYLPSQVINTHRAQNPRTFTTWDAPAQANQGGSGNGTNDTSARTYHTGDTGHVKLTFTQEPILGSIETDANSEDELVAAHEPSENPVTSPILLPPTTPGLAGHKRDIHGNVLERTPAQDLALLFPLEPRNGALKLSQLFKQTQADSSPFPGATRSDPIFERPSPDMGAPQQSPLRPNTSSPVMNFHTPFRRAITEPKNVYESMKESQERRARVTLTSMSPPANSDDEDELGENSDERRIARKKSTERLKKEAMKEFANYGAPLSRHKIERRRKSSATDSEGKSSGQKKELKNADVIVISDDIRNEELAVVANSTDEESMDEYDEYSQTIIPSERQDHRREESPVEVPTTITRAQTSQEYRRANSSPLKAGSKYDLNHAMRRSFPGTLNTPSGHMYPDAPDGQKSAPHSQILAVADSQPSNSFQQPYLVPPPRPVAPSSINSRAFLSQSQGFSLSSNVRQDLFATTVVDDLEMSSIPFPPPLPDHFRQAETENYEVDDYQGGSSPPVAAMDLQRDIEPEQLNEDVPITNHGDGVDALGATGSQPSVMNPPGIEQLSSHRLDAQPGRVQSQIIPETSPTVTPLPREIPDSDPEREAVLARMHASFRSGSLKEVQSRTRDTESANAKLFGTAQTHQSTPASTTPKKPRIPRMTDIAAGFTPPGSFRHDLGEIAILNDEDLDFHAAISKSPSSSPPTKRARRNYGRRAIKESGKEGTTLAPQGSPLKLVSEVTVEPTATPPLVARREREGAAAAASARLHVVVGEDAPQPTSQLSNIAVQRKPNRPNATVNHAVGVDAYTEIESPVKQPRHIPVRKLKAPGTTAKDTRKAPNSASNLAVETPRPRGDDENRAVTSENDVLQPISGNQAVPSRVLAKFRGLQVACHPATALGVATTKPSAYKIRFDDGTIDEVDQHFVRRFELQLGDVVKVDLPNLRTRSWVVHAFKDQLLTVSPNENMYPKTDVYGHQTVVLKAKHRLSLPRDGGPEELETIEVPMTSIYIPLNMFARFKDRVYHHDNLSGRKNRFETPTVAPSIPTTPSSRTRRHTMSHVIQLALDGAIHTTTMAGIFTNMAFAISYSPGKEAERNRVSQMIKENGGTILAEGFDELFDTPTPAIISPSKLPRPIGNVAQPALALLPSATTLGFVALIADCHSRRAKYMQALALNIPCLSGRWILDCLGGQSLVAWDRYLLPAGESSFLDGAIRSRTFNSRDASPKNCTTTKLSNTIQHRPKLLDDKCVILVMGEGKVEERRKAYLFLTLALGAKCVERVKGIKAAKIVLEQQDKQWDWVYVDDVKLKEAGIQLNGLVRINEPPSKKRKRDSVESAEADAGPKKARLVGDEFVMQSLILGALLEDA